VDVTVDDGVLTLRGEKKSEHQDKDRGWSERYYGRFERSIVLPDGADEENCQGVLRDGVLTVRMPKSQRTTRGRRIPLGDGATQH
jgi:HSP20 family protein